MSSYVDNLQDVVANDASVIGRGLMTIGRQVRTDFEGIIDILAIDSDGNLVVVELKRGKTPRDVVAQVLDYGSWVQSMSSEKIGSIFLDYQERFLNTSPVEGIDDAMEREFGSVPNELNSSHRLVIAASTLDQSTERIVTHLRKQYDVPIDVAMFQAFRDGERRYLSRTWLGESQEVTADSSTTAKQKQAWNGECYVSFGEGGERRSWSDAKEHGFISAGGGKFYVQTLKSLKLGERVWVKICELPTNNGYVGVGIVRSAAIPSSQFAIEKEGVAVPVQESGIRALTATEEGEEEYYVGVDWIHTVDVEEAVWERGFFGNQNTVARPRDPKWGFTVEFLKRGWKVK